MGMPSRSKSERASATKGAVCRPVRVGHQATEDERPVAVRPARERQGLIGRLHAGAAPAGFELDQDADLCVGLLRRRGHGAERHLVVEPHREPGRPGKGGQRADLSGADDRVAEQDVAAAGLRHHQRLRDLLAGDADRTELDLASGELRQLVGLDVRPQLQPVAVAVGLHPREIPLHPVEVDEGRGGVEGFGSHPDSLPAPGCLRKVRPMPLGGERARAPGARRWARRRAARACPRPRRR